MNYNKIVYISAEALNCLKNLRSLDLGSNHLTSLPGNVFVNLTHLQEIYLPFNPFVCLPEKARIYPPRDMPLCPNEVREILWSATVIT
jgi:Leucine-rich repeat (LRR) protein